MIEQLSSISLSVLDAIGSCALHASTLLTFFENTTNPSEILDHTDEIINEHLKIVDMNLSIISNKLSVIGEVYKVEADTFEAALNRLREKLNSRRIETSQLNTNTEFFDDENPLKQILDDNGTLLLEPYSIMDQSQYSAISIIQKIEKSVPEEIRQIREKGVNALFGLNSATIELINRIRATIGNLRVKMESSEYATKMATDVYSSEIAKFLDGVKSIFYTITSSMTQLQIRIKSVFNAFLALDNNNSIYNRAINQIVSVSLESLFNNKGYIEFC